MPGLQRARLDDGIEVLRLDRPEVRNALGSAQLSELEAALSGLAGDDALRAVVVSTTDVRALCSGADVGERLDHAGGVARMEAFARVYAAFGALAVPTVAVCVGNVVGAGVEIAAGCDLRIGGDNLKLVWAGARMGAPVGPARLVPLVGLSRAKELVLTGRVVGMDEALAIGFLHRGAAAGDAEAAAIALAREVAAHDPDGVRSLLALFRELERLDARVAHENERLVDWQRHGPGLRPRGGA